jgi:hypothetical protein
MANSPEILRDKANIVRRISHARSPYRPRDFTPASPITLAKWYLEKFGDQFGLPVASLVAQKVNAQGAVVETGLELSDVNTVRDRTTVVSFAQKCADLPIFEAGLAVRVLSDLSGVISAQSTLHLDVKLANGITLVLSVTILLLKISYDRRPL